MTIDNSRGGDYPGMGSVQYPYKRTGLYHVPAGYWTGFIDNPTAQEWKDSQSVKAYATGTSGTPSFGQSYFGGDPVEFTLQFYNFTNETVITGPEYRWHATASWPAEKPNDFKEYYPGTPHAWWHALGGSVALAPGESTFRTFRYHPAESANDYVESERIHTLWKFDPSNTDWGTSKTPCVTLRVRYSQLNKLSDFSPKYPNKLYSFNIREWFSMFAFEEDAVIDVTSDDATGICAFTLSDVQPGPVHISLNSSYWPSANSHSNYIRTDESTEKKNDDGYYNWDTGYYIYPFYLVEGVPYTRMRSYVLTIDPGETIWVNYDLNGVWVREYQRIYSSSPATGRSPFGWIMINGGPNYASESSYSELTGLSNLGLSALVTVPEETADSYSQGAYSVTSTWRLPDDGVYIAKAPKISNARFEKDGVVVSSVPYYDQSHIQFRYDYGTWTLAELGQRTTNTYSGPLDTIMGITDYYAPQGDRSGNRYASGAFRSYIPKIGWHNRVGGSSRDSTLPGNAGPWMGVSGVDTSELRVGGGQFYWERIAKGTYNSSTYTDLELYTNTDSDGNSFSGLGSAISAFTSGSVDCIVVEATSSRNYSHFTYVGASCELTRPILTRAVTQNTDLQGQPVAITKAAKNVAVLNQDGYPTGAITGVQDGDPVQLLYRLTNTGGSTATPISKPFPWHGTGSLFGTQQNSRTALNTYNSMDFITNSAISPGQTRDAILVWTPRKAGTFTYSFLYGDLNFQWSLTTNEEGEDPSEVAGTAIVKGNLLGNVGYGFQDFPELGNLYGVQPYGYRSSPYPPTRYSFVIITVELLAAIKKKRGGWNIGSIGIG
jgi:uncharacterized protein YkuJ